MTQPERVYAQIDELLLRGSDEQRASILPMLIPYKSHECCANVSAFQLRLAAGQHMRALADYVRNSEVGGKEAENTARTQLTTAIKETNQTLDLARNYLDGAKEASFLIWYIRLASHISSPHRSAKF